MAHSLPVVKPPRQIVTTASNTTPAYKIQQRELIQRLGARGARFVRIKPGAKKPKDLAWNETANTLTTEQALTAFDAGHNIGLAAGTGNLYVIDFDRDAKRGHIGSPLSGGLYTYRRDALDKAKFIFYCPDPLPTHYDKAARIDLLGINANGTHAQAVIAGIHHAGEPILSIPELPIHDLSKDTIAALWEQWTGRKLEAPERQESTERDAGATYATADLGRVADALHYIDPNGPEISYKDWINCLAALHDAYGDDALDLAVDWAQGKPGEVERKWRSFKREYTGTPATLKTIFYFARRGKWPDRWLQDRLCEYRQWMASPAAIQAIKEAGFKNPEQARKLLDAILQRCEEEKSLRIAPGYAYLSEQSTIAIGGLSRYLARLFAAGLINLQMGKKGGAATGIELVLRNVNSSPTVFREVAIHVAKNWPIYRSQRASEIFINGHHAYSSTRTQATLPALGANGLGALLALVDGSTSIDDAAKAVGYSYGAMAATLRRYVVHDLVEVDVGAHNRKIYTLKPAWRKILAANRSYMPTYAVQLERRVKNLASREDTARYSGDHDKADRLNRLYAKSKTWLTKIKDRAGIIAYVRPRKQDRTLVQADLSTRTLEELVALDPDKPVKTPRPYTLKIDHGEEWVTIYRPIYEQWQQLIDVPHVERYRLMGIAGYTRTEIDASIRMAGKMGRGPRHFAGVGDVAMAAD